MLIAYIFAQKQARYAYKKCILLKFCQVCFCGVCLQYFLVTFGLQKHIIGELVCFWRLFDRNG